MHAMEDFPRTDVGGVSVSRMIIGTNWFLGYTHCTAAKSEHVVQTVTDRDRVAAIIAAFMGEGVDTIMCPHTRTIIPDAIAEAEQRSGRKAVIVSTPGFGVTPHTAADGFDLDEVARALDAERAKGVRICMPHVSVTDTLLDKCTRRVRHMDTVCAMIRERGMVPGLSTHTPETVIFADESGLDVETYIQPLNPMGFLMHLEVDWVCRIIQEARKPVMTIKTMAAGQIRPLQAMTFVWNVIRPCDMVTVGTVSAGEALELVELSRDILARRPSTQELQRTRSKNTL
jgi:hypothetical protein